MMFATQPIYQQQEQQQQQQQQQPFSNPFRTTATAPFARTHSHSHSHYSTPTRPSPLSPRRHHSSPFSSSSSTASTMTAPSTPNTSNNNRNLFSSPLANTAAPPDPDTPLTTFLPSSPLQPGPSSASASCLGSPVQKPFSAAAAAGPLFSFHPDTTSTTTTTTTSPIASTNNPSRFATRYAAQIANPLTNAAARNTRLYTGTSASPAARNTRRHAFLNRVKRDRADGRFENRGEQLVLLEHVAEQKRWGEAMRRSAVSEFGLGLDGLEEEEEEDEEQIQGEGAEMDALDQYLLEQERGAIAAAEEMGVDRGFDAAGAGAGSGSGSGSFSDEDYDDIFMDLAGETGMGGFAHSQEMDMS